MRQPQAKDSPSPPLVFALLEVTGESRQGEPSEHKDHELFLSGEGQRRNSYPRPQSILLFPKQSTGVASRAGSEANLLDCNGTRLYGCDIHIIGKVLS